MDWQGVERYAHANRSAFNPPRKSGLVITSPEHVGEAPPVASNETWDIAEEMWARADWAQQSQITAEQERQNGNINLALFAYAQAVETIGPLKDYARQIQALHPKAPGDTPPPALKVLNEYGTYQGHGLAVDLYPLGRGQNSKGFVRMLPIDVRLEAWQFQGPLTQWSPAPLPYEEELAALAITLGTNLHTRVARPVQPLKGGITGREIKAFWVTHVSPNSPTGQVEADDWAWTCFDSGIEFERLGIKADAAHEHWAISYSGQLSPNGEGDPADLFAAFHAAGGGQQWYQWKNVGQVPGPQEYLGRRGWRGLIQAPPA